MNGWLRGGRANARQDRGMRGGWAGGRVPGWAAGVTDRARRLGSLRRADRAAGERVRGGCASLTSSAPSSAAKRRNDADAHLSRRNFGLSVLWALRNTRRRQRRVRGWAGSRRLFLRFPSLLILLMLLLLLTHMLLMLQCPRAASGNLVDLSATVEALVCRRGESSAVGLVIARRGRQAR